MVNKFSSGTVPGADIMGPHCAVVLGVAKLGHEYSSLNILHVTVNDKKVELLNFSDNNSTVLSALLACRTHRNEIYGKPGLAKTFTLNGKMCVIKGEMPVPAVIKIDNNNADLSTPLKEGDKISFTPAINGKDATSRIDGLITAKEEYVFSSDGAEKRVCFPCKVTVNDIESTAGAFINDRDDISVLTDYSLKSALRAADIDPDSLVEENIAVNVLGDIVEKTIKDFMLIVNGNMVTDTSVISAMDLKPGDRVEYQYIKPQSRVCDFISVPAQGSALKIKINGEEFVFPGSMGKILLNGRDVDHETPVNDGDIIRTVSGRDAEAALVDIFKYIAVDPKDTVGKRLKLFVNQQEASFTTPLQQGADVSISFE